MFDPMVLNRLPEEQKEPVNAALVTLLESGLFQLQEEELLTRLGQGSQADSDEVVLEQVKTYRRQYASLVGLRELSKQIKATMSE